MMMRPDSDNFIIIKPFIYLHFMHINVYKGGLNAHHLRLMIVISCQRADVKELMMEDSSMVKVNAVCNTDFASIQAL